MQIRSDEQQFQELDDDGKCEREIMESAIKMPHKQAKQKKNCFNVKITPDSSPSEKALLENQYYIITVLKQQIQIKKVKRRFSDFDMLFEILFREYKGYIFPAFPENGILSYVKSKVYLTKDDKFLEQRIKMVQRFLTILLNQQKFDDQNCQQMKAFLSQKQFDLFKKRQKQKTQGIITSSWNKIVNYMKFNQQSKYKVIHDQLVEDKKNYEQLLQKTRSMIILLNQQKQESNSLRNKNLQAEWIQLYLSIQEKILQEQHNNLNRLRELQFSLQCQNQDYEMVFKVLKSLQNLKNDEQNYSSLEKAEKTFSNNLKTFKKKKEQALKKYKNAAHEVFRNISQVDSKF